MIGLAIEIMLAKDKKSKESPVRLAAASFKSRDSSVLFITPFPADSWVSWIPDVLESIHSPAPINPRIEPTPNNEDLSISSVALLQRAAIKKTSNAAIEKTQIKNMIFQGLLQSTLAALQYDLWTS